LAVINLTPPPVCASEFAISTGGKADAGADGQAVRVSVRLAEFTPGEHEFAFIVAHELAHNILGHRARLDAANVKRGLGRMFGKSKKLIRETEAEADRLAIWLMANAGFKPEASLGFIERYDKTFGPGIFSDGTHMGWKERRAIMQEELAKLKLSVKGADGYLPPLLMPVRPPAAR
jgi:predicted Zn-dependent protease